MRNKDTLEMTTLAMFIAIIVVMAMIPYVGFIPLGPASITIVHVPVIIGAILKGKKFGLALGLTFGLFSFFRAFSPFMPADPIFQNPLISVVPRALFGLASAYIFILLRKHIDNIKVAVGLTFALSTLAHTILVLSSIVFAQESIQNLWGPLYELTIAVMTFNGPIEIALAIIIGTPIVIRLKNSSQFSLD